MVNFFKSFGKGVLYVLVLPVLVLILALYAVFALFGFIYLTIKSLILFFTGRSLFDDLPEDKKAKAIIKANTLNPDDYIPEGDMPYVEEKKESESIERNVCVSNQPASEDPFYVPEYLKKDEEKTPFQEVNEPEEDDDLITPNDILFEKVKREEETNEENESSIEETNNGEQVELNPEIEENQPVVEEKEDIPYVHTDYHVDDVEEDEDDGWDKDSDTLRL